MTPEQTLAFNAMVRRINAMEDHQLEYLLAADRCPYEPEHLLGVPLGMMHCEVCGEMVVCGLPHGRGGDVAGYYTVSAGPEDRL